MAQELATLASEVGMAEFRRREDTWMKGKEDVMDEDTSGTFNLYVIIKSQGVYMHCIHRTVLLYYLNYCVTITR